MRKYQGNREDEMIGDALGTLQGMAVKKTITKDNCGKENQFWYNNVEKVIPEATGNQWYAKKDVVGIPGFAQQRDRGTPRVIVLIDGNEPKDVAWFSKHYTSFEELDAGFFKRGEMWKKALSQ